MKFTYRFPALVSAVPPGLRTRRDVMVLLDDAVDVPVVSVENAPVAARIPFLDSVHRYRYMDGEFYVPTGGVNLHAKAPQALPYGAQNVIAVEVLTLMAARRPTLWPSQASPEPYYAARSRGEIIRENDPCSAFTGLRREKEARMLFRDIAELRDVDDLEVEFWRRLAGETAARNVVLSDGWVWTRVEEPVMRIQPGTEKFVHLHDISLYAMKTLSVLPMPEPFGSQVYGRSAYWGDNLFFAMNDLDGLAEAVRRRCRNRFEKALEGHGDYYLDSFTEFEVPMPGVFGTLHAERELEREARLAVVRARRALFENGRWGYPVDASLKKSYRTLLAALPPVGAALAVADGLDDLLEDFGKVWAREAGKSGTAGRHDFAFGRMKEAVRGWRSRPISIDLPGMSERREVASP